MTQSVWQLRGRNALVTGATRGIGRAIVSELLELGASVTLVARTQGNVDKAVAELGDRVLLSRDLHPELRAAGGASVIHIGSVGGLVALPTGVAYAIGKAGLAQAGRTLALEWARDGIRVNTIMPWYTRTPLVEPVLSRPEAMAAILNATPMGRIAEPHEIAAVVAFLALPAASYVTGQTIAVDGGMSIQGLPLI